VAHGLPLTVADRKASAERILGTHPYWSDRAIAMVAGLSHKTVGAIRRCTTGENAQSHTMRIGRDGRVRRLNATEGRRRAGELLAARPTASLRQISTEAGVSTATVRDVRERLRRGEDPLPPLRQRGTTVKGDGQPLGEPPAEILRRLRVDPSLRFNESGRALLRVLEAFAVDQDTWDRLIAAVPEHCTWAVADLVAEGTKLWQQLAEQLKQRTAEPDEEQDSCAAGQIPR
jgi:hypothetical protein